ncbi:MAG: hypothetical protein HY895_10275 [Deltaproteobacteria bacterium]|nr:hypothetical protein [Deltaproteobacteria bacterium]
MNELPVSTGWHEDEALLRIARGIRQMPDLEPAVNLLPSIMAAVRPQKRPWWYRMYRWAKAPRSITFSPLQTVPAAVAFAMICIVSILYVRNADNQGIHARQQDRVAVVFSVELPTARSVSVIGSFSNWQPHACELKKDNGEGVWTVTLLLPAGRYEYAFLVDGGTILSTPRAGFHQDDGFGNQNNFLVVGNDNEKSI